MASRFNLTDSKGAANNHMHTALFATIQMTTQKSTCTPTPTTTENFVPMLNGIAINQLTFMGVLGHNITIDAFTGCGEFHQNNVHIRIENYAQLPSKLRISTYKLLDICVIELTRQNTFRGKSATVNPVVRIPINTYMELRGVPATKPSKDKSRRIINEDLNVLNHIYLSWTEPFGKKTKTFESIKLCDSATISSGEIIFAFSINMATYLTNAYLMQYPLELLKISDRNSNIYSIGKKLALHNSIDNNKHKGTDNILSVKSLLHICPDIPSYESIMSTTRHLVKRIITPFENSLNALPFLRWNYTNPKNVPLTEEQRESMNYHMFKHLLIKFTILNAPDQTSRLAAKRSKTIKKPSSKHAKAAPIPPST